MCASFSDDDVGKTVVNASGEEVGMVTVVEHGTARVKPDPGITDSIKATLGWEGSIEDTYPLQEESIDRITHDEIRLTGDIHEGATSDTMGAGRTGTGGSGSEEITDRRGREHEESAVPDRDVGGRGESGGRGHPEDRPMDEPRDDGSERESGLMDPDRDERTDSTPGSRGHDEKSEAMDPDVGDGDRIGDHDEDAGIADRERRSRDSDSDDDSDRS